MPRTLDTIDSWPAASRTPRIGFGSSKRGYARQRAADDESAPDSGGAGVSNAVSNERDLPDA
jgi:hypothetical protein